MELIKFNLFDNNGTYRALRATAATASTARSLKVWKEMRLPPDRSATIATRRRRRRASAAQGELIRFRTAHRHLQRHPQSGDGIDRHSCSPATCDSNRPFRILALNELARNRHGGRHLRCCKPDPQVISRKLFTRDQIAARRTATTGSRHVRPDADCAYQKAPFFNVLAAFWIQFMTHDWFSHLDEARNDQPRMMTVGCTTERRERRRAAADARARRRARLPPGRQDGSGADRRRARPADVQPHDGTTYLARAPQDDAQQRTAWWDASQIYGYDERRAQRVRARSGGSGQAPDAGPARHGRRRRRARLPAGVLPAAPCDPIQPDGPARKPSRFPTTGRSG